MVVHWMYRTTGPVLLSHIDVSTHEGFGRLIFLKDFSFHDFLVGLVRALKSFNTFTSTSGNSPIFSAFGEIGLGDKKPFAWMMSS